MVLPKALITPVVSVWRNPNGFPRANTFWPTTILFEWDNSSELYQLEGALIRTIAKSLLGSAPISLPGH